MQDRPQEVTHRLFRHQPAHAELLRRALLPVRVPQLCQRHRPDILHGLLPRRRVQHVRLGRAALHRDGARRPCGSHGAGVPKSHQVHVPQVRSVRIHPEVGRPVRVAAQHCQRENLRIPVVLVLVCRRAQRPQLGLSYHGGRHAQVPFAVVEG